MSNLIHPKIKATQPIPIFLATISAETAQAMEQASSAVAELAQQSQALQQLIVEMKNG